MSVEASPSIDTRSVACRRTVQYQSFDDLLNDIQHLIDGGYRTLGNWGLDRIVGHLAAVMEMGLDGAAFQAPWLLRLVAKPIFKFQSRGFTRPMSAGFKLPPYAAPHLIPDDTSPEESLDRLRRDVQRWGQQTVRHPHPIFGQLTNDEWVRLQLRHAEMHMSFVVPATA